MLRITKSKLTWILEFNQFEAQFITKVNITGTLLVVFVSSTRIYANAATIYIPIGFLIVVRYLPISCLKFTIFYKMAPTMEVCVDNFESVIEWLLFTLKISCCFILQKHIRLLLP